MTYCLSGRAWPASWTAPPASGIPPLPLVGRARSACRRPGRCRSPAAASAAVGRRSCVSCRRRRGGLEAGLDLGDHARVDDVAGDQVAAAGLVEVAAARRASLRSSSTPGVSLRKTSFSALRWAATAAAAVSALTLWTTPRLVRGDAADHRDPAGLDQVQHRLGAHPGDLPHEAEVHLLAVHDGVGRLRGEQAGVLAGEPDGKGTMLVDQPDEPRWTCPTRTMRTTSMASGVVTRSPPRNSEAIPSRSSIVEICGPPPSPPA